MRRVERPPASLPAVLGPVGTYEPDLFRAFRSLASASFLLLMVYYIRTLSILCLIQSFKLTEATTCWIMILSFDKDLSLKRQRTDGRGGDAQA